MNVLAWRFWLILAACPLLLLGCGTAPKPAPQVVYQKEVVKVAVSCVPSQLGRMPPVDDPHTLATLTDGPERYLRIWSAYLNLWSWGLQAEPVLEGCRAAAPAAETPQ